MAEDTPSPGAPAPGKRPPRRQTRETVREAAFRLFGRHGYDGVSIDTIARAVGLSKGALYWHFDGKEALFRECLAILNELFREHIIGPVEAARTPEERLDRFFEGVISLGEAPEIADGIAGYWQEPYNEAMNRCFRNHLEQLEEAIRRPLRDTAGATSDADPLAPAAGTETGVETLLALMEAMLLPLRRRSPALRRAIVDDLRTAVRRPR
ncbi:helix-turn-helix domain-containing protein [Aquisalimonas lutea]|uniref:TetR/AcrR family transcriptional regulator n=1 Tax=Aquisalimonas lutea TaxID=1327750 RepID=UPI0025B3D4B4|nr:TetR/AcrR family transcriptional regulator [Aquisalimonas lutea]MDN3518947.1 helix-turn-helix domain-containing protein [Aquisalimonas lutea]